MLEFSGGLHWDDGSTGMGLSSREGDCPVMLVGLLDAGRVHRWRNDGGLMRTSDAGWLRMAF